MIPSLEEFKEYLSFNNETGLFTWIKAPVYNKPNFVNTFAGGLDGKGYLKIGFKGEYYFAHRLAWLYIYNEWPITLIDHINGNTLDNRIINLRQANYQENGRNQYKHRNGKLFGATYSKTSRKWTARISVYLGVHDTELEAHNTAMNYIKYLQGEE